MASGHFLGHKCAVNMKYCDTENKYSGTLPIQHPEQGKMFTLNLNLKVFLLSKTVVAYNIFIHIMCCIILRHIKDYDDA